MLLRKETEKTIFSQLMQGSREKSRLRERKREERGRERGQCLTASYDECDKARQDKGQL